MCADQCNRTRKFKSFEVTEAALSNHTENIRLCLIYRQGTSFKNKNDINCSTTILFLQEFEVYLDEVATKHAKSLLRGDFNFHLEKESDSESRKFSTLISDRGFSLAVDSLSSPTHCSGGALDVFIVSRYISDTVHISLIAVVKDTATSSDHYLVKTTLQFDVSNCFAGNWQEKTIRELNNIDVTN